MVAVASTDGENVDQHYGRTDRFYVYRVDDDVGYDFVEMRKVQSVCMGGSHSVSKMMESVLGLSDCRYVVASRIGDGASSCLRRHGIVAVESPGTVDDAILKVWKYNQIQNLF